VTARYGVAAVFAMAAMLGVKTQLEQPVCVFRIPAAQGQINTLLLALEVYKIDNGRYPSTAEGLNALRFRPGSAPKWKGPYWPQDIPTDPWGRPYVYRASATVDAAPEILSYGADGKPGGTGSNSDVHSGDSR
jgi:general secretion pathway protein G